MKVTTLPFILLTVKFLFLSVTLTKYVAQHDEVGNRETFRLYQKPSNPLTTTTIYQIRNIIIKNGKNEITLIET